MGNSNSSKDGRPKLGSKTTSEEATLGRNLSGKVGIVTGCSGGIGLVTVTRFVEHGCTVIMANRNEEKSKKAREEILENLVSIVPDSKKEDFAERLICLPLDLSSLQSVQNFVTSFIALNLSTPLSLLVNNAGIMALDNFTPSSENYELQFATNFLGHFYLTVLLINHFEKTLSVDEKEEKTEKKTEEENSVPVSSTDTRYEFRVVNVASTAHSMAPDMTVLTKNCLERKDGPPKDSYGAWSNYGISKSLNIIFARELSERYINLKNLNVISYSLHPGVIQTGLQKHMGKGLNRGLGLMLMFLKSITQGAATTTYLSFEDYNNLLNGGYYADCNLAEGKLSKQLRRSDACKQLTKLVWEWGELLVQQRGYPLELGGTIPDDITVEKVEQTEEKKDNDNNNDVETKEDVTTGNNDAAVEDAVVEDAPTGNDDVGDSTAQTTETTETTTEVVGTTDNNNVDATQETEAATEAATEDVAVNSTEVTGNGVAEEENNEQQ